MKLKKILAYSLVAMFMLLGVTNVEAESYTKYKAGDEITVNLNDTLQAKFYVIEDNDDSVTAIYKGSLGEPVEWNDEVLSSCVFENTNINTELNNRTANWTNATNIHLPSVNDIIPDFDYTSQDALDELVAQTNPDNTWINLEKLSNIPFWALNDRSTNVRYYTSSVTDLDDEDSEQQGRTCDIYYYGDDFGNYAFLGKLLNLYPSANIRPVITVSKTNVVGGIYISKEEKAWTEFIESFKKTEIVDFFETSGNTVEISSTENSLTVVTKDDTNTVTTNFKYENGIVTYIPSGDDSDNISFIDNFWIANCLYAIADMKGYDIEKLNQWYVEDREYTLAEDGIAVEKETTHYEEEGASITMTNTTAFSLDIVNGLKSFENMSFETDGEQTITENPETNSMVYVVSGILMMVAIATLVVIIYRQKNQKA